MSDHRLTPEGIRAKQFATTRLRPGYDEDEVDAFLDLVESELSLLLRERGDAWAELGRLRDLVPEQKDPRELRSIDVETLMRIYEVLWGRPYPGASGLS